MTDIDHKKELLAPTDAVTRPKRKTNFVGMRKSSRPDKIPNMGDALHSIFTASWLMMNDDNDEGAKDQFLGENINLSLVSALLFTTFLPLFYNNGAITIPDEGYHTDVFMGYFGSRY